MRQQVSARRSACAGGPVPASDVDDHVAAIRPSSRSRPCRRRPPLPSRGSQGLALREVQVRCHLRGPPGIDGQVPLARRPVTATLSTTLSASAGRPQPPRRAPAWSPSAPVAWYGPEPRPRRSAQGGVVEPHRRYGVNRRGTGTSARPGSPSRKSPCPIVLLAGVLDSARLLRSAGARPRRRRARALAPGRRPPRACALSGRPVEPEVVEVVRRCGRRPRSRAGRPADVRLGPAVYGLPCRAVPLERSI